MRLKSICKPRKKHYVWDWNLPANRVKAWDFLPHFLFRSYRSSYQHWVHWVFPKRAQGRAWVRGWTSELYIDWNDNSISAALWLGEAKILVAGGMNEWTSEANRPDACLLPRRNEFICNGGFFWWITSVND